MRLQAQRAYVHMHGIPAAQVTAAAGTGSRLQLLQEGDVQVAHVQADQLHGECQHAVQALGPQLRPVRVCTAPAVLRHKCKELAVGCIRCGRREMCRSCMSRLTSCTAKASTRCRHLARSCVP